MLSCSVSVGSKMVVLDGEARWCMMLAPPDPWANAYAWDSLTKGIIQAYPQAQRQPEYFDDPARMQWAVDAWNASPPSAQPEPPVIEPPEDTLIEESPA